MVEQKRKHVRPAREQFADLLQEFRRARGMTQGDLARAVGISQAYLSQIEQGERPPPADRIDDISKALKLSPQDSARMRWAAGVTLEETAGMVMLRVEELGMEVPCYQEAWIVGEKPIEFPRQGKGNDLLQAIVEAIHRGPARYVYWVPGSGAPVFNQFLRLVQQSLQQRHSPREMAEDYFECILCPEHFCVNQYAIYNPKLESRIGRMGLFGPSEDIVRTVALPQEHTDRLYRFLLSAYHGLKKGRGRAVIEGAKFRRHYPPSSRK